LLSPVFSAADGEGWGKYVLLPDEGEWLEQLDWIVPVIGRRSRGDIYLQLRQDHRFHGTLIDRIGDCVSPRLIQLVLWEAYEKPLSL